MPPEPGVKYDKDKLRWDLIPWNELEDIVRGFSYGARKYSDGNWMKVPEPTERYFAALMRHITAWRTGENLDQESGLPHLAHAACCLLFLMWHDRQTIQEITAEYISDLNKDE